MKQMTAPLVTQGLLALAVLASVGCASKKGVTTMAATENEKAKTIILERYDKNGNCTSREAIAK